MRTERKCPFWFFAIMGLAIQSFNFAAMALLIKRSKDLDSDLVSITGISTNLNEHLGYIIFIMIGAGLSVLCYFYIVFPKLLNYQAAKQFEWFVYTTLIYLQFMVCILTSAWLINDTSPYNFFMDQKDRLQAAGATSNSVYATLSKLHTLRIWGITAACATFVFGFIGGLVLLFIILQQQKEELIIAYQNRMKIKSSQFPNRV